MMRKAGMGSVDDLIEFGGVVGVGDLGDLGGVGGVAGGAGVGAGREGMVSEEGVDSAIWGGSGESHPVLTTDGPSAGQESPESARGIGVRGLLGWNETRQEPYKRALTKAVERGENLWAASKRLGLTNYILAQWRNRDERIDHLIRDWEAAQTLSIEQKFEEVMQHPERFQNALGKPAWFNFHIARLKALDSRYKDNSVVNVDARTLNVGMDKVGIGVGEARDNTAIIEGLKKQLLKQSAPKQVRAAP